MKYFVDRGLRKRRERFPDVFRGVVVRIKRGFWSFLAAVFGDFMLDFLFIY
jgi:hypothetical protein